MSELNLEPTNVGPAAGGNLRASDQDREQVARVLSTAYAEGRLDREEYDERIDRSLTARTFDELIPLTHDLVVVNNANPGYNVQPATPASANPDTSTIIDTHNANPDIARLIGIFGGATRKGKWRVRRTSQSYALFGGVDLDMSEAVFEAPVVEITGAWVFGGLDIKVPEGIEVRDEIVGIFGGSDVSRLGEKLPGAPVLVVKGIALFGGVSIHGPSKKDKRRSSC